MKQGAFLSLTLTAIIGAISTPTLPSFAQAQNTTIIGDLQQRARGTTIPGEVASVVGNDFTLRDSYGEIIVDAGSRWWRKINPKPGGKVTVRSQVSKKSGEFDAFSITRADGSVIQIRPAQALPPWQASQHLLLNQQNRKVVLL